MIISLNSSEKNTLNHVSHAVFLKYYLLYVGICKNSVIPKITSADNSRYKRCEILMYQNIRQLLVVTG
jgi:hypothetical protein